MLEEAGALGLKPLELYELTFREFLAFGNGVQRAESSRWRRSLWLAWHGALFARMKKLPKLAPLLDRLSNKPRKVQSSGEMLRVAEMIVAAMGGKDLRKSSKSETVKTIGDSI